MITDDTRAKLDGLCASFEASEVDQALADLEDARNALIDLRDAGGMAEEIVEELLKAVRPFLANDADEETVAWDLADALSPLTRLLDGWSSDDTDRADVALNIVGDSLRGAA